ncbi:MAG: trypsin-like peptidase domain-containing protein [Campylobacterales bacterium]|nr:trypsin-like peptidase domain-containing protein [Campylobacterales bacterium]
MNALKFFVLSLFLTLNLEATIEDSIVKIYTVFKAPNYDTPWNTSIHRANGSGAIIAGNRILTNAHVVANTTFLEVQRNGDTNKYKAQVEYISHQADLALLKLEDESFFEGTKSLELGTLPKTQDEVVVYGFPMGGTTLSITKGVVSRVEHIQYAHSSELFLGIQVDAAINPGNSGGPAIVDGKIAGVVMQGVTQAQNLGYLIPTEIIEHFFEDIKDGKYDGFADLGITTLTMENESMREYYKMDANTSGILVTDIAEVSDAYSKLKINDIITAIDGHTIQNDSKVEFRQHQFTFYPYYLDKKQIGQSVTLDIIREGKKMKVDVVANRRTGDTLVVDTFLYDTMPRYYILGGYVFTPLTRNLLHNKKGHLLKLRLTAEEWASNKKKEAVLLLNVLAHDINRGDYNYALWMIDKVNGEEFVDFNDFVAKIKNSKATYIILEGEKGSKVIIDRQKALATQKEILQRYSIQDNERL